MNVKKEIRNYGNVIPTEMYSTGFNGTYLTTFANKKFAVIKMKNNGKKYILVRADNLKKRNTILFDDCMFGQVKDIKLFDVQVDNSEQLIEMAEIYFEKLNYEKLLKLFQTY